MPQKNRCLLLLLMCLMVFISFMPTVLASEPLDASSYESLIEELTHDLTVSTDQPWSLSEYLAGNTTFSLSHYIQSLIHVFFDETVKSFQSMQIIMVYLLCGLIFSGYFSEGLPPLVQSVSILLLKLLIIKEFVTIESYVSATVIETIDTMYGFVIVLLSSINGLAVTTQPLSMVSSLKPLQILLLPLTLSLLKHVILPVIQWQFLASVLGQLSKLEALDYVGEKMTHGLKLMLSLCLKIYFSFLTLSSSFRFFQTRLSFMQGRHLLSQVYSMTQHWFKETAEVAFLTLNILRDALSVYGVMTLLILVALPLIKIMSIYLVLLIFYSFIQAFNRSEISSALTVLIRTIKLFMHALMTFSFLFVGNILVIIVFAQFFKT